MVALIRIAVLLPLACLVAACASGPQLSRTVTVEPGKPTRVLLTQVKGQRTFLLQNASSRDAAAFYGDQAVPPLGKVVPDEQLQALLDVFSEKGMFPVGSATAPPDARDVLTVEHDGRRWVWARRQAGLHPSEAPFHEAQAYFLEVYNSSTAYHGTDGTRPDLQGEQDRVRTSAEAARTKLEGLRGRPQ